METFKNETWRCPDCERKLNKSNVKDWKCPNCVDPIWIMVDVNGNKYVLERIKAKEIQKDDVILLDGMHYGDEVKKVKKFGKKIRIYFKNNPTITETSETFFNTIIGNWEPKD